MYLVASGCTCEMAAQVGRPVCYGSVRGSVRVVLAQHLPLTSIRCVPPFSEMVRSLLSCRFFARMRALGGNFNPYGFYARKNYLYELLTKRPKSHSGGSCQMAEQRGKTRFATANGNWLYCPLQHCPNPFDPDQLCQYQLYIHKHCLYITTYRSECEYKYRNR